MGKKILIIIGPEYQDLEVWYPYYRLKEAEIEVQTAGIGEKEYKGKYGYPIKVDSQIEDCKVEDFDGVIIPGGWAPDKIRMNTSALDFVKKINDEEKLVASICHGGWVLASAEIINGRKVTAYEAIQEDMKHAGADFKDMEVCVDNNIITSRKPDDLPAFCKEILNFLS